jgi:transaldolase
MKFFIDSANIDEIKQVANLGICDGVTTNPTLVSKLGLDFKVLLNSIVEEIAGPVSAEVIATDFLEMIKEAEILHKIANNIVIKLPLTQAGLRACKVLASRGIKTNVTLCFSVNQALLAAKCGATYISPFIGRLEDSGQDGIKLIKDIKLLYQSYAFETKILAASIRNVEHVQQAALAGADVATIPFKIFSELYIHPLTDKGLSQFMEDWKNSSQKPI